MSETEPTILPTEKICTLDGFLRQFIDQHQLRPDQPFCFILGAGASRDSGIKTGAEMAQEWVRQLYQDKNFGNLSFEEWIEADHLDIPDFDLKNPGSHYSKLYERLFHDKEQAGFSYLESVMEGTEPSFGYSVLSYLLGETHHRIVITTNFDNLVTDALAIHADTFPIVVNDDTLVSYVRANVRRPLVAKIHGSLGFSPKSTNDDLTLSDSWRKALSSIFQTHTPVVIGYDGNDGSLMRLLHDTDTEDPPEFLWWCYYCPSSEDPQVRANAQPKHVLELVSKRRAQLVPIPGFDLFMLKLLTEMGNRGVDTPNLIQRLEQRSEKRIEHYKDQRDKLGAALTSSSSKEASKETPSRNLKDAIDLLAKDRDEKPWWKWQIQIDAAETHDEKDDLYQSS